MRRAWVQVGKSILVLAAAALAVLILLAGYGLYPSYARPFFYRVCSLFTGDGALRCLMTIYLSSLVFQALHFLVPLACLAALGLLCRAGWRRRGAPRQKLWWLPVGTGILAAALLTAATALFVFQGGGGLLQDAGGSAQACRADLALLKAGELSTYDGPLYDAQFTSTWALSDTSYSSVPDQRGQPQLFHVSSLGGVELKLPEELYQGSGWLERYVVRYLPHTGVAVSIDRVDSGRPGPDQWKYGDMIYEKSRGRAVTVTGEELPILGYGRLTAGQQRFLDLLMSDILVQYYSHSWSDFINDITWDDDLTASERESVFQLYALFQKAAYSVNGYLGFYPYSFSFLPSWPNRISIDTLRSEEDGYFDKALLFSQTAQEILHRLPEGLGDYGKMKWVAEYIVENTQYAPHSQFGYGGCAYGCLVEGGCVCAGYADAYAALLYRLSIPCVVATSTTHGWNVVKLGSKRYHIDTTWMDQDGWVDYTYFLQEEEDRLKEFQPQQSAQEWEDLLTLLSP